jgi:hypothetical protein|tara:strand:+ start:2474 stop:2773 length:300 start_codon:yes stop_codon:yes gene_type:complete
MTKFEVYTNNPTEIVEEYEEAAFKTKEQHMGDYIKSMKALEDAMEPYKEQKRDLKTDYIDSGWLTKEDISLTTRAYRLLKNDVDIEALIDIYENLRKEK